MSWKSLARWDLGFLAALVGFPLLPDALQTVGDVHLGSAFDGIFIFAMLALGLNVVVGYAGMLQLGIAAFFAIGAYVTGILTVSDYPFQVGFWWALPLSAAGAALVGVLLAAPTLRLRGDYLAIVTLGFAEVIKYTLINLEEITAGSRGLNPVPPPSLAWFGLSPEWREEYRWFYYLQLGALVLVLVVLRNLERSRLGRALAAIREDELAATCAGVPIVRVKLAAFAIGAAIAGAAGCLYATRLSSTSGPSSYDFSVSIIALCYLIVGGLGNPYGAILGAFVIRGFEFIVCPLIKGSANWRYLIFGMALILMMRFRPQGALASKRERPQA